MKSIEKWNTIPVKQIWSIKARLLLTIRRLHGFGFRLEMDSFGSLEQLSRRASKLTCNHLESELWDKDGLGLFWSPSGNCLSSVCLWLWGSERFRLDMQRAHWQETKTNHLTQKASKSKHKFHGNLGTIFLFFRSTPTQPLAWDDGERFRDEDAIAGRGNILQAYGIGRPLSAPLLWQAVARV